VAYFEVVRIHGIQRDLVNRIFFTCNWSKLYKYKIRLELENGTEKSEKHWESAEFRARSFCVGTLGWPDGCSGVGFGFGFEGASSGSAGLVAFWLFCVVNFGWSGGYM
jgi:hypothetical protein